MPEELLEQLTEQQQEKVEEKKAPNWISPMLATLTEDYFSDPDWIFERKLDGERCVVYVQGGEARLGSRNKKEISSSYPELIDALEDLKAGDFIADGEIVAFDNGISSFSRLQSRMQQDSPDQKLIKKTPVFLYLFDLLHAHGHDLTGLPLRARKALLQRLIDFDDPIRYLSHRNEEGEAYREEACEKGWEGIIAKDSTSPYVHSRSKKWLKFKCVANQELVIGGYTPPKGSRIGFGALLVGFYEGDKLRYAGKVGTGYDDETLERLHGKMQQLERKSSPFADEVDEGEVHYITPELVGEFGFTEWTNDHKLRHPRFLGLRDDKNPKNVKKEKVSRS